jgi:putative NADPH-quinone reductase
MRILVLYAHPVETSFVAALRKQVVDSLGSRGHEVDDCDLNLEGFDPVMSRQDRIDYKDTALNRKRVAPYVDRLLAADALVLVFPVWNEGFPAILKGFLDRVFLPGVSLEVKADGSYNPSLRNITKLATVCTYGLDRFHTMLAGDPPRRVVKRTLRSLVGPHASCDYLAHYDMNHTTPERRARFLSKVKDVFEAW